MDFDYLSIPHLDQKTITRLFSKICVSVDSSFNGSPCWEWTASLNKGYGQLFFDGRQRQAYRITYAWLVSPIPHGQAAGDLDHLCRNKKCVNPCHLDFVSHAENAIRAFKARSICKNGHSISGGSCATCKRDRQARRDSNQSRKEYMREYQKQYRAKNGEKLRAYDRDRNRIPERKAEIAHLAAQWKRRKRAEVKAKAQASRNNETS